MTGTANRRIAPYPLRVEREKLDRLAEIARSENRTIAGELRQMIDERIAADDARKQAAAP